MLCPYCKDKQGNHLPCTKTLLTSPERFNTVLVKVGHWECEECDWVKPIYQKQPLEQEPPPITINCHCCRDSGEIHPFLVRNFLMEDYGNSDPPVPCKRCKIGMQTEGWDIATKADCDRIHKLEISKAFLAAPEPIEVQAKINELASKF